jgi:toxin YoeB
MELAWTENAKKDLAFWRESNNGAIQQKITSLLANILEHPFSGLGKPEPLKYRMSGCWSRRISQEHRLVYRVVGETVEVLSCRWHYEV